MTASASPHCRPRRRRGSRQSHRRSFSFASILLPIFIFVFDSREDRFTASYAPPPPRPPIRRRDRVATRAAAVPDAPADDSDEGSEALRRVAEQLERLKRRSDPSVAAFGDVRNDPHARERAEYYKDLICRPANDLKSELGRLGLKKNGRKPDLARRLADYYVEEKFGRAASEEEEEEEATTPAPTDERADDGGGPRAAAAAQRDPLRSFAGLNDLSAVAGKALAVADFARPSPIQAAAIPAIASGEDCVLHAPTGSGKTLAYLLPLTERLWREQRQSEEGEVGCYLVLTPTRELAAQVAGVASALSPPGTVRLVSRPADLSRDGQKEKAELPYGGRIDDPDVSRRAASGGASGMIVGSAKAVMHSLYGDGKMPASPTSKPMAVRFLRSVRCLVLDEVDRLLNVKKGRTEKKKRHEKPAAVVCSAIARLTLGRAQCVAASATVGRPLRRELSRVLGLPPQECPAVVRGRPASEPTPSVGAGVSAHVGRAVTVPPSVRNYVVPTDGSTSGSLLTTAAFVAKSLPPSPRRGRRRVLFVLTRDCGLTVRNTLGALKHFGCDPEPRALLDALEADGTDRLIDVHREVSGSVGVGESSSSSSGGDDESGYLLVTGEDSIRGLHLDNLNTVIVVGRPAGPDEYTHIAGRTGRAGRKGDVINVVSYEQAAALTSWERMLDVDFIPLGRDEVSTIG